MVERVVEAEVHQELSSTVTDQQMIDRAVEEDMLFEDDGDEMEIDEQFSGKGQYQPQPNDDDDVEEEEEDNEDEAEEEEGSKEVDEMVKENSNSDSDKSVGNLEGPVVHYNPDAPKMEVGTQFPSVKEFRNALRQHCILNEFGMKFMKNDRLRLMAKCERDPNEKRKGCNGGWPFQWDLLGYVQLLLDLFFVMDNANDAF
ncbi:hypothetical protein QJS04_geneDACA017600 [Acorus gramineus]|uniref:Transposase MuDR plant domain-containing protein n=1 Tax=Acorus gramineus TaxID=55184 RepID=A0AAV9AWX0_ACOGR|nr:hypothetical protein QJS04_geneDACA017600 [Acorus gramineus]